MALAEVPQGLRARAGRISGLGHPWKRHAVGAASPRDWLRQLGADIVLLDGTFWSSGELPRQAEVPHPPVRETLELLGTRREDDPRVVFIHLNHTNPLCNPESVESTMLVRSGWEAGREGMSFQL